MILFFKKLFCIHNYINKSFNLGYYDQEEWIECTKCGKQISRE